MHTHENWMRLYAADPYAGLAGPGFGAASDELSSAQQLWSSAGNQVVAADAKAAQDPNGNFVSDYVTAAQYSRDSARHAAQVCFLVTQINPAASPFLTIAREASRRADAEYTLTENQTTNAEARIHANIALGAATEALSAAQSANELAPRPGPIPGPVPAPGPTPAPAPNPPAKASSSTLPLVLGIGAAGLVALGLLYARRHQGGSARANPIPSQAEYERREAQMFQNDLRRVEAEWRTLPRAEKADEEAKWLGAMAHDPKLVAERVGWLLAGNYGYGSYKAAHEVIRRPRMNQEGWLVQVIGALEWQVPIKTTQSLYNRLTKAQQTDLTGAVRREIEVRKEEYAP